MTIKKDFTTTGGRSHTQNLQFHMKVAREPNGRRVAGVSDRGSPAELGGERWRCSLLRQCGRYIEVAAMSVVVEVTVVVAARVAAGGGSVAGASELVRQTVEWW
jgi:hypothetical protein